MDVIYVLAISVLLQFTAAFLALRLIRVTERRIAWILISAAISLMAIRRSFTLFHLLSEEIAHPPDLIAELVALATSALMVAGIASIAPIFHFIKRSEEALREMNRSLKVLIMSNQAVIRATEESALLKESCRIIAEVGGYRMVWIGFAEQDDEKTIRPVAYAGHDDSYLNMKFIWADTERGRSPTGKAIRTGKPCISKNILTDPEFIPWRDEATKRGYASLISLPLIANDKTLGALNIYAMETDAFDTEEVNLLTELANDVTYGIMALRTRNKRILAEKALSESEEKFMVISASAKDAIIMLDNEGNISYWNEAAEKMFGYSSQEALGKEFHILLTPEHYHEAYRKGFPRFKETGQGPVVGKILELMAVKKDRTKFPIELSVSAAQLKGKWNAIGIVRDITERKKAEELQRKSEEEIKKRVKELEEFYQMAVGRELKMKELKEKIESLKEKLEKYKNP